MPSTLRAFHLGKIGRVVRWTPTIMLQRRWICGADVIIVQMIIYQPRTRFHQWLQGPEDIYYLRIGAERAIVRNVRAHDQVDVTSGGMQAVEVVDLCAPPATLAAYIPAAAQVLRRLVDRLAHPVWWRYPLRLIKGNAMLVHPLQFAEGDLPEADSEVLRAIATQAGFRRVAVWTGRDLSDEAVQRYFGFKDRRAVDFG